MKKSRCFPLFNLWLPLWEKGPKLSRLFKGFFELYIPEWMRHFENFKNFSGALKIFLRNFSDDWPSTLPLYFYIFQIFNSEEGAQDGMIPVTKETGKNGAIVFVSTVSILLGFGPISVWINQNSIFWHTKASLFASHHTTSWIF